MIGKVISALAAPVTNFLSKRSDNKAQVTLRKIDRLQSAEDKVAEWENMQAEAGANGWKDEWVTVIVTLPIPVTFLAVFVSVLFNLPEVATAAADATKAVKELVPNYGELLYLVCLAAIGIRAIKR